MKFYPSANNFTQAPLVMLVTNIMSYPHHGQHCISESELTQRSTCNCGQHPGLISACHDDDDDHGDYVDYDDGDHDDRNHDGDDSDVDGEDDLLRAQAQQQMKRMRSAVEVASKLTVISIVLKMIRFVCTMKVTMITIVS